jgi:hypothetical protein
MRRHQPTYLVVRRFLPLARLRDSTLRPPPLELRFRNPCFLFPFLFFGWYVRFISMLRPSAIAVHLNP